MAIKLEDITEDRLHDECDRLRSRINELERRLQSWLNSNDAMEWLDDDSPLVVQTRKLLDQK